jgi:hypothetical protein
MKKITKCIQSISLRHTRHCIITLITYSNS